MSFRFTKKRKRRGEKTDRKKGGESTVSENTEMIFGLKRQGELNRRYGEVRLRSSSVV